MAETSNDFFDIRKNQLSFPNSQTVKFQDEIAAFSFKHNRFLKVSETSKLSEKEFIVLDLLILPNNIWEKIKEKWDPQIRRDMSRLTMLNKLFDLYASSKIEFPILKSAYERLKNKHSDIGNHESLETFEGKEKEKFLVDFKIYSLRQMQVFEDLKNGYKNRLSYLKNAMENSEKILDFCYEKHNEIEVLKMLTDTLSYYANLTNELVDPVRVNGFDPLSSETIPEKILDNVFENSMLIILQELKYSF